MIILVTLASVFIDRDRAGMEVIAYVEAYLPIRGDMQTYIFDAIAGVIKARGPAGAVASVILLWSRSMFHHTDQRNQPRLGHRRVQLVAAAAEQPDSARNHRSGGAIEYRHTNTCADSQGLAVPDE